VRPWRGECNGWYGVRGREGVSPGSLGECEVTGTTVERGRRGGGATTTAATYTGKANTNTSHPYYSVVCD